MMEFFYYKDLDEAIRDTESKIQEVLASINLKRMTLGLLYVMLDALRKEKERGHDGANGHDGACPSVVKEAEAIVREYEKNKGQS